MLDLLTWASDGSLRAQGRPRGVAAPLYPLVPIRPRLGGCQGSNARPIMVITIRSRLLIRGPELSQSSTPTWGPPLADAIEHVRLRDHLGTRPSLTGIAIGVGAARKASTVAALCRVSMSAQPLREARPHKNAGRWPLLSRRVPSAACSRKNRLSAVRANSPPVRVSFKILAVSLGRSIFEDTKDKKDSFYTPAGSRRCHSSTTPAGRLRRQTSVSSDGHPAWMRVMDTLHG
jgi:hypothetical protein